MKPQPRDKATSMKEVGKFTAVLQSTTKEQTKLGSNKRENMKMKGLLQKNWNKDHQEQLDELLKLQSTWWKKPNDSSMEVTSNDQDHTKEDSTTGTENVQHQSHQTENNSGSTTPAVQNYYYTRDYLIKNRFYTKSHKPK
ncbi:hypothetical protein CHUAL_003588 [Chamberlinius hualienensis]